jgi:hypothetical protein
MPAHDLAAEDLPAIKLRVGTFVQPGVDTVSVTGRINCDTAEGRASVAGTIPIVDMSSLSERLQWLMLALRRCDLEGVYPVFTPRVDGCSECDFYFFWNMQHGWKIP